MENGEDDDAISKRVGSLEHRVKSIERSFFGFHDDDKNSWVPGMLQMLSEMKTSLRWFVRIAWVIAPLLLALVAHQYGAVDVFGKFLESFH